VITKFVGSASSNTNAVTGAEMRSDLFRDRPREDAEGRDRDRQERVLGKEEHERGLGTEERER
jgi:hypothetical protein